MSPFLRSWIAALVAFLVLDALWLGVLARRFYREQLGELLRPDPRWGAAALFYALYVTGIVYFVVLPALERQSLSRAALGGAAFGLIAYAAYDLTNLATLRGFPVRVVAVDLTWGAVITAAAAVAAFVAGNRLA